MSEPEEKGIIGKFEEDGLPVIVKFVDESPGDQFMAAFNKALRDHPQYPLEINFYEDPEWSDFQKLRESYAPRL